MPQSQNTHRFREAVIPDDNTPRDPKAGDEYNFDNGGRIKIDLVKDGWVYYVVYCPKDKRDPGLWRKTIADWHDALAFTRQKIEESWRFGSVKNRAIQLAYGAFVAYQGMGEA